MTADASELAVTHRVHPSVLTETRPIAIWQVLGNPSGEVLCKFKRNGAAHVDFNFATQKGIGVAQLIPHASPECVDLITKACPIQ